MTSNERTLPVRLMFVFVSPGETFQRIASAPPNVANWVSSTILVAFAGIVLFKTIPETEAARQWISALAGGLSAFVGVFWSALVLWFIGRVFLKTRFPFMKAVEIVALSGLVLALGTVVTALLISVSGDPTARPALSLFVDQSGTSARVHAALDVMNLFHLWTTTLLAMGLSRLSGVSFKESAFWVFGYWFLARIALALLA